MKYFFVIMVVSLLSVSSDSYALDSIREHSIKDILELQQSKLKLGSNIKFFFGDQSHGKVLKKYDEFKTNKKENAFGKLDIEACQTAFLSAMISLRDRVVKLGGNAVINIKSNYKNNLSSSKDNFQCGVGVVMAGVALVGTVVEIKQQLL